MPESLQNKLTHLVQKSSPIQMNPTKETSLNFLDKEAYREAW